MVDADHLFAVPAVHDASLKYPKSWAVVVPIVLVIYLFVDLLHLFFIKEIKHHLMLIKLVFQLMKENKFRATKLLFPLLNLIF